MIKILCFIILFSDGCHSELLKSNNDATNTNTNKMYTLNNSPKTDKLTTLHYIAIAGIACFGILVGIVLTTIVCCILLKR
jgi:hypothetical protein